LSIKDVFDAFDGGFSVYLLFQYKSTNTDTWEAAAAGKDRSMLKNALLFMDTPSSSPQAAAARFSSERDRSLQV